ncbi:hypothetical protein OPV22_017645 [Ensete ventricosum]|uniref:Serine aminopeptidase S33 domain-containing protein n=1 Tax=Ensete ventricosum TaxID=4639 RepID=A0AAV8R064_ENSVE|nr:hypothetical protein OPV22_017645 [Ensete ventricosum]
MAERLPTAKEPQILESSQSRVEILNKYGERLVGVLHDAGSKKLVILCHGFRSSKDESIFLNLTSALTNQGISVFRFDFAGNGQSDGIFRYGNYRREAEDLRAVILYFSELKYEISAILGHSKGGNVVLLYASVYHDVHIVINLSGRFALDRGIEGRLGRDFMQRIEKDGFIDVKDRTGKVEYWVTEESLKDRLDTDMHAACHSIDKECRVLTIHGSKDEIVPMEDAMEFAKLIPNHKLYIMEGANHSYAAHQGGLASVVLDFLRSNQVEDADTMRTELGSCYCFGFVRQPSLAKREE